MSVSTSSGKATIIIVTYNNLEYLARTQQRARRPHILTMRSWWSTTAQLEMQRWLDDYASKNSSVKVFLDQHNLGFAAANNIGIRAAADSEYIVLLNNDCIVTPSWLTKLIQYLRDPKIGMVGPVTNFAGNEACVNPGYFRLESIDRFARMYTFFHHGQSFDISMLAMFCVATRREVIDKIGPLDDQFGAGMFEDDDYAERVRAAGYRIVCAEDVYIHHFGRSSFSKLAQGEYTRVFVENRRRFEAKWQTAWTPPRTRPGVLIESWSEHVARREKDRSASTMQAARSVPLRMAKLIYYMALPYKAQLIVWTWGRGKMP